MTPIFQMSCTGCQEIQYVVGTEYGVFLNAHVAHPGMVLVRPLGTLEQFASVVVAEAEKIVGSEK